MRKTLICILLVVFQLTVLAQKSRQYSFNHFSAANGLASNFVNGIVQDADGYMWIGTYNGLQRYDGNKFITFRAGLPASPNFPLYNIAVIYKDKKDNIWLIGANGKVGTFDTHTFQFSEKAVLYANADFKISPKTFVETVNGELAILQLDQQVYEYSKKLDAFEPNDKLFPSPPGWVIAKINYDSIGKKYWLLGSGGIAIYNPFKKQLSYKGHNVANDPFIEKYSNNSRWYLQFAEKDINLFVSWPDNRSYPSFIKYYNKKNTYEELDLNNKAVTGYHQISGVLKQRNGRYWVYGMPFLAEWLYDKNEFISVPNEFKFEYSIRYDNIFYMYEDRENNLWLCTDNGLYVFNPDEQVFRSNNVMRVNDKVSFEAPVQTILELKDKIILGTWSKGIYYYDKNFNPLPAPPALAKFARNDGGYSFWHIIYHPQKKQIWMGMQGSELLVLDAETNKMLLDETLPIFGGSTIRQLAVDKNGDVWFGLQNGKLIKWSQKESNGDLRKGYSFITQTARIYKLFVDTKGFLWVGTLGRGLLKYNVDNNQLVSHYTESGKPGTVLNNNSVVDILQYDACTLLLVTDRINLLNTCTNSITQIGTADGFPSNTAVCAQMDKQGIVWVGMINGLVRANLEKKIFTSYDRRDGMTYDNFGSPGAFRLSDGRMIFTTDHDFLVFDPVKISSSNIPLKPVITDIRLGDKTLLVDSVAKKGKLSLDYDDSYISIDFNGLDYTGQKKLKYFYKLDNLDDNWKITDNSNRAIYNYLPSGSYTFSVKAQNEDGKESKITTLPISVRPPFWKSWWFYGFVLLAVIGALFYVDKERVNRLKAVQQTRSEIAGTLHDQVQTTLNNINILSEMAKMKAEKDIEKSKEYIEQISNKSHNMIIAMDDMLWTIDPENDNLEGTFMRMREFVDALQNRHDTDIKMAVGEKVKSIKPSMKTRSVFFLLFKEILRLFVEKGMAAETMVNIDKVKNKLVLKIKSNQELYPSQQIFFTQQVEEMQKQATIIHAEIDLQIDKQGVAIILLAPLNA